MTTGEWCGGRRGMRNEWCGSTCRSWGSGCDKQPFVLRAWDMGEKRHCLGKATLFIFPLAAAASRASGLSGHGRATTGQLLCTTVITGLNTERSPEAIRPEGQQAIKHPQGCMPLSHRTTTHMQGGHHHWLVAQQLHLGRNRGMAPSPSVLTHGPVS
jgi:hypothetical protein